MTTRKSEPLEQLPYEPNFATPGGFRFLEIYNPPAPAHAINFALLSALVQKDDTPKRNKVRRSINRRMRKASEQGRTSRVYWLEDEQRRRYAVRVNSQ